MSIQIKRQCLLFIVLLSLVPSLPGQEARKIRWDLQKNDKLLVKLEQLSNAKTQLNNRSQEIKNDMILEMDWTVADVNPNVFTIKQEISRIKMTVTVPSATGVTITTIDTTSDSANDQFGKDLLAQVTQLIGATFVVEMNTRGELLGIDVPAETKEVLRQAPSSMQIREVLSKEGLEKLFGSTTIVFPEEPVQLNDTWSEKSKVDTALGQLERINKFSVTKMDDKQVEIGTGTTATILKPKSEKEKLKNFKGDGKIVFAVGGPTMIDSRNVNKMTTVREFRDKKLQSTIETEVILVLTRKNE